MEIKESLKQAGLTGNESGVYLELIKRGKLSANEISKNIGIDRTLAYTILNHLIEKGHVSHIREKNKKLFSCSNPETLLNSIRAKETLILDLVTELKKIKPKKEQETKINVYEGKEGLRTFMSIALKHKELMFFGSTGRAFFQLYEMPAIAKEIIKKKISVKILGNKKFKGTEPFNYLKFEYRYSDVEAEATTSIFGDYVTIHLIKERPLIIMIKNKDISDSYKNYFEFLWGHSKSL